MIQYNGDAFIAALKTYQEELNKANVPAEGRIVRFSLLGHMYEMPMEEARELFKNLEKYRLRNETNP